MLSVLVGAGAASYVLTPPAALRRSAGCERCAVSMQADKKIVVTGLGTVTAIGSGDEFWSNLINGVSGVDTISSFDASRFPTTIGAECKDFDAKKYFNNAKNMKATDRYTHLAMAASRMAVEDGGLDLDTVEKSRFGVVVGSAFGGMDTFEKQVLQLDKGKKISPFVRLQCAQSGRAAATLLPPTRRPCDLRAANLWPCARVLAATRPLPGHCDAHMPPPPYSLAAAPALHRRLYRSCSATRRAA